MSETGTGTCDGAGFVIPPETALPVTIYCQGQLPVGTDCCTATYGTAPEYFVVEYDGATTISILKGGVNVYSCTVPSGSYKAWVRRSTHRPSLIPPEPHQAWELDPCFLPCGAQFWMYAGASNQVNMPPSVTWA